MCIHESDATTCQSSCEPCKNCTCGKESDALVSNEENEILKLQQELQEYKDKYLRALAEIENSRKRLMREKLESQSIAIQSAIIEFLEPLDHFELAMNHAKLASSEVSAWAKGFEMILQQLFQVLEAYDVRAVSSVGAMFDPHLHEAIEVEERTDVPEGTIIREFKKGYTMGQKTIRPAKVLVAQAPKEDEKNNGNKTA